MWVFAGGMYRSGSTLQYQLVSDMIERAGLGQRSEWMMPEEFAAIAEPEPPGMRVFKTHVCKHPMRIRLRDGRAMGVGVHRDLRDAIVSGAQKEGVEPDAAHCAEMVRGMLACWDGWPECAAMRWWSYERLMNEPETVCVEMGEHLGVPCSPAIASEIAQAYSPPRQLERIEHAIQSGRMVPAVAGSARMHAAGDLLHPNHLHDGRSGKWRSVLSADARRAIEDIAGAWLTARGYALSDQGA